MTREERRRYAKEYREEGFGRIVDRAYYMRHRQECLAKQRERDAKRRLAKLSQDCRNAAK